MIEVVEIDSFEQLSKYSQQWNELLQNSDTNVVFLTYEYCRSWWEVFGSGQELLVLMAKKQDRIIGIAPLTISISKRAMWTCRVVKFLGYEQSDYMDFIIGSDKKDVLKAFYQYLWSAKDRWDTIKLEQIPEYSSTISCLREHFCELETPFFVRQGSSCPIVQIEGHREEIARRMRCDKSLKSRLNRIKRTGEVVFGHVETVEEGLFYLDVFFQMHISRWEHTPTPSTFYRGDSRVFYQKLVQSLLPKGWMRLSYLKLDSVPIALLFDFEYNGSRSSHRGAFNRLYYKHAPGKMILHYALQYCLDNNLHDLDLLAGEEGHKEGITNETRRTNLFYVYKSRTQRAWDILKWRGRKLYLFALLFGNGWVWRFRMNLRKYLGRYGVLGCIKKAVHRIVAPVFDFSSNLLFQWSGSNLPPTLTAKCPLEIQVGSDADLNLIASFHGYTEESSQIAALKKRMEQGDKPYLASCGKTLAHIAWVCRRREVEMGEIWGSIALGDNEAYIMDCHTSFIFRGKGIYPVVLQRILKRSGGRKGK